MIRRTFIALAAAAAILPGLAQAKDTITYQPGLIQQALDNGETVFVDFFAEWCTTCRSQERAVTALRAQNPAYDEAITFISVDYDKWGREPVSTSRNIPRRSTLIVLKGDAELGRIVADPRTSSIEALLNTGLAAAGS